MENIGKRVKRLREERGLSQRGLAALCGCSGPTISDIENGHTKFPSAEVLARMCEVFGVTERYVLYGEDGEVVIPTAEQQSILSNLDKLNPDQRAIVVGLIESLSKTTKS